MQKLILLSCVALLGAAPLASAQTGSVAAANEADIPASVVGAIRSQYPNVVVTDWDWEDDLGMYEAEFKMNGREHEAYITPEGTWVRTKTKIKRDQMPAAVMNAIRSSEYGSWRMDDFVEMDTPDKGKLYKVEVEKGNQEFYLKYDANGNLVEKMSKEEKKNMKKK